MPVEHLRFIYRDARGTITARLIGDVSESDECVQGVCLDRGMLRTFRKDRVLEPLALDAATSFVDERLAFHREAHPAPLEPARSRARRDAIEVCFTGFKSEDKQALIAVATDAGFIVRPAVTTKLHFLCCGDNAGPAKVRRAREQGVLAITAVEFRTLAETGEVPDDDA